MAKIKRKLIKKNKIGPLIFTENKFQKDGLTHNVKSVRIKSKKKKNV
jgi:hypothetical protein